jgi:hypothetical protein
MRYYYKVTEEDSPVEIALGNPVYSSSPTPDIDKLFTFFDKDGFPVTDRNTNELKAIALPSTREGFSFTRFFRAFNPCYTLYRSRSDQWCGV